MAVWHTQSTDAALESAQSRADGLTDAEAARRLSETGPNELPAPSRVGALEVLTAQLHSVIVYLLAAAIAVSLFFDDLIEAAAIAAVLLINTAIGFITEFRARRAMEALISLDVPHASVIRNGDLQTIPAREIVPGDIIEVDGGRRVPADGRLIQANDLQVDEAPLTGESMPVAKASDDVMPEDTPLADRVNMIYMGTTAATGVARAVVTATGQATELGRVGTLVSSVEMEPTPLERRLDALGRRLVWLTLAVAALVAALGLLHALPLHEVVETAIALAVAAVPEALPAVATIALATGMARMAKRHALVRRLPAVESLGSTTVVCTDKTRTLTSGEMAVVRVQTAENDAPIPDGDGEFDAQGVLRRLFETVTLASRPQAAGTDDAGAARVDPVDRAMLAGGARAGIDRDALVGQWRELAILPFTSDRKLMAAFHDVDGRCTAFVKGAPAAVLERCARIALDGGDAALNDDRRAEVMKANEALAARGLRVIGVAAGETPRPSPPLANLTWLGLVGLADPPAEGVKETIETLRRAHLRTVMLTGDQRLTAEAIGRDLGVIAEGDTAIDGRELDRLDENEISDAVGQHAVFSRITPEHKLTIVRALQARGEIVAMLGDGVNDAAALKQADVGVSMGRRGTDVAKRAAAIVLQDDRFDTVAAAVEEGRVIYDNIRKFVFYLFSCNVAEVLVLLTTSLAGWPLPLGPLQLLWMNLVTDTFPALALALEPADRGVMTRPPRRPDSAILSRSFLAGVLGYGSLLTAVTVAAFAWGLAHDPEAASTIAFMTLAFAQIGHLGNARREGAVITPGLIFSNPFALLGAGIAIGLQLLILLVPPLAEILGVVTLDGRQWAFVAALAATPAVAGQAIKLVRGLRR